MKIEHPKQGDRKRATGWKEKVNGARQGESGTGGGRGEGEGRELVPGSRVPRKVT